MSYSQRLGDEYARQLQHIRDRLRSYPDGHVGLQAAAMFRMADLIRLGRFADIERISSGVNP